MKYLSDTNTFLFNKRFVIHLVSLFSLNLSLHFFLNHIDIVILNEMDNLIKYPPGHVSFTRSTNICQGWIMKQGYNLIFEEIELLVNWCKVKVKLYNTCWYSVWHYLDYWLVKTYIGVLIHQSEFKCLYPVV